MSYDTFSDSAPVNNTGSLSSSYIETIPNNPTDTNASVSNYPSNYDQFVNKTEGRSDQVIAVIAERHSINEIFTQGSDSYLYLHHQPANISSQSFSLSQGSIVTGFTDYSLGLIKFNSVPVSDFYISYLARMDALYAEHINALQNSVMNMQRVLGAGSVQDEGMRNATFFVDSLPAELQDRLPNAILISDLQRDLDIKGDPTGAFNITIGNGNDNIELDTAFFKVGSNGIAVMSGQFGDSRTDWFDFRGPVKISTTTGDGLGTTGQYGNAALAVGNPLQSSWSGAAAGPYPNPANVNPIAKFFGDIQVIGNVYLSGVTLVGATATGAQVSIVNDSLAVSMDLIVTGDSYLGSGTSKKVEVGGYLEVGRYLHVQGLSNDVSRFDTAIFFKNQGNTNNGLGGPFDDSTVSRGTKWFSDLPLHISSVSYTNPGTISDLAINKVSHVDGLDASYIAKNIVYRAHDRSDFKNNCINLGPYSGHTGSITSLSAPGTSQFRDTNIAWPSSQLNTFNMLTGFGTGSEAVGRNMFRWFHMGGDYYHGKFNNETFTITGEFTGQYNYGDGPQWMYLHLTNDTTSQTANPGAWKYGARVPLSKIDITYSSNSPWMATGVSVQLSRAFNTPLSSGDTYMIYHPSHSLPFALRKNTSTSIKVYASTAEPIIATVNGIKKVLTQECTESISTNYTGMNYVFLECRTPETAKLYNGHLLESEPTIAVKTTFTPDDSQVPIGEFYSIDPGMGIVDSSIVTYRYNTEYDSLWIRANGTGNLWAASTGVHPRSGEFAFRSHLTGSITQNNTGSIESGSLYNYNSFGDILATNINDFKVRLYHNFGTLQRAQNADLKVMVAPNYGTDYTAHGGGSLREGPDYAYVKELPQIKYTGSVGYPCYDVAHVTNNYIDLVFYEIERIPGAVIGARSTSGYRNLVLTGSSGSTNLTGVNIAERERNWYWIRTILK